LIRLLIIIIHIQKSFSIICYSKLPINLVNTQLIKIENSF